MNIFGITWDWKEYISGFFLGCIFWQYKYVIYKRFYDWWK